MVRRVCNASQNVPSIVKLSRYAATFGPSVSNESHSARSDPDALTSPTGTLRSNTSNVIATANTPSANVVTRSRLWPEKAL
jgi:hypothetical protein